MTVDQRLGLTAIGGILAGKSLEGFGDSLVVLNGHCQPLIKLLDDARGNAHE